MWCTDQEYQSIAQPGPQHQPLGGGGCWCNVLVLVPSPTTAQHMCNDSLLIARTPGLNVPNIAADVKL